MCEVLSTVLQPHTGLSEAIDLHDFVALALRYARLRIAMLIKTFVYARTPNTNLKGGSAAGGSSPAAAVLHCGKGGKAGKGKSKGGKRDKGCSR